MSFIYPGVLLYITNKYISYLTAKKENYLNTWKSLLKTYLRKISTLKYIYNPISAMCYFPETNKTRISG